MRRTALAILTVLLLIGGSYLRWAQPDEQVYLALAALRMAVVTGAAWLAYPQLERASPWLVAGIFVGLLIVAWRPKAIWVVLPIIAALWLLRPRGKA